MLPAHLSMDGVKQQGRCAGCDVGGGQPAQHAGVVGL